MELITIKIWRDTKRLAKELAARREMSLVALLDKLVNDEAKMTERYQVPKSFCPYCFEPVFPMPNGYHCKTHGPLTILQVISERIAELRRKRRDESQGMP